MHSEIIRKLELAKSNMMVSDAITKADSVINNAKYHSIICSISGGADSDIMLDIIHTVDVNKKVRYVWFDTGFEYLATKRHLDYLENRYQITIERERAEMPIPLAVNKYGEPFVSKHVSYMIEQLQKVNFKWEDKSYEELLLEYPNVKGPLKWWCNCKSSKTFKDAENSRFNISRNKWLKEFMLSNPPKFRISHKCCDVSKKKTSHRVVKKYNADLIVVGVRKSEGGARATAYKNCYSIKDKSADEYRPLFWITENDKQFYENTFNILHSDCYTKMNFPRTGCVCCPYAGKSLKLELRETRKHEPNMYNAACNIFKNSYEYTKQYRIFVQKQNDKVNGVKRLFYAD